MRPLSEIAFEDWKLVFKSQKDFNLVRTRKWLRHKTVDKEAGDEEATEETGDGRNMETRFHHMENKD